MLGNMFGCRMDAVTERWRKLHKEEFHSFMIGAPYRRRDGSCGTYWEELRSGFCWGNAREIDHWQDLGVGKVKQSRSWSGPEGSRKVPRFHDNGTGR